MKVREVMSTAVITTPPTTSFKETAELMLDYAISGVPVVDTQRHVLGVVTEADLMSKEAFSHRHHRPLGSLVELMTGDRRWTNKAAGLTAADVMTTDTITVRPDEDIRVAARRMLDRGVKRLVVLDEGELVGIVSRYDLLRVFHRADTDVADEIRTKLGSPRYCPEDHSVTFTVEEGVVTLSGGVRFAGEVAVVEGMAWDVPGVVQVVSDLSYDLPDGG